MSKAARRKQCALTKRLYGVGISWDEGPKPVDLDLQAVIVDEEGFIVDAVYYNNLIAANRAVGYSGDEQTGEREGFDEIIWVNLTKLPRTIKLIIFVVAAHAGGSLRDVQNGRVSVVEQAVHNVCAEYKIESSFANADIVLMFKKGRDETWQALEICEPAEDGAHFLDILEPNIGDLIRQEISNAPMFQRVAFQMEKGCKIDFPMEKSLRRMSVHIGGAIPRKSVVEVDMDIAAIFYSKSAMNMGVADHNNPSQYGVAHTGESHYTAAEDIDEALTIDLTQIPPEAQNVFLLLSVHRGTFEQVSHCYARIEDQDKNELIRFDVEGGEKHSALLIGRVFRSTSQRWSFQALGGFFTSDSEPPWDSDRARTTMAAVIKNDAAVPRAPKNAKKFFSALPVASPTALPAANATAAAVDSCIENKNGKEAVIPEAKTEEEEEAEEQDVVCDLRSDQEASKGLRAEENTDEQGIFTTTSLREMFAKSSKTFGSVCQTQTFGSRSLNASAMRASVGPKSVHPEDAAPSTQTQRRRGGMRLSVMQEDPMAASFMPGVDNKPEDDVFNVGTEEETDASPGPERCGGRCSNQSLLFAMCRRSTAA